MTARKSIRSSRYSIQSQASGVLNPDSSISEIEDNTFWYKDFKDDSVVARPSQRFGAVQDDPILNPDSEPDATPLRKSWWKELDDTTEARRSMGNASRGRSSVSEKSLDASDLAVMNEGVLKPRSKMPRVKRKSSGRNVFSDILASTSRASSSREETRISENKDRESSVSLTDSSVERIRQPPLKKKKRMLRGLDSESESDNDGHDIFQDALEAPESETIKSKGGVPSDISEATTIADSDSEGRKSPLISRTKKRTMFAKTGPRKSAHFDDLLMNTQSEDEPSVRRDAEGDRSTSQVDSRKQSASKLASGSDFSIEEEDSISDDSVKKQRPVFPRKKQGTQEDRIAALLSESSETSTRSEPIAQRKTQEFLRPRDVSASKDDRRSSKQRNDRSRASGSLNSESAERQTPRSSSSGNKSGKETSNRTPAREKDAHESDSDERSISEREEEDIGPLGPSDHEMEDSQPPKQVARRSSTANKSDNDRRSRKEASDREKSFESEVEEENRSARTEASARKDRRSRKQVSDREKSSGSAGEENRSVRTEVSSSRDRRSRKEVSNREKSSVSEDEEDRSARTEGKAGKDRRSRTEAIDRDKSLGSEDEENRSVRTEVSNRSHRRSVNKENDRSRVSQSKDGNDGNEASHGAEESEDEEERTMIAENDPVESDEMEEAQRPGKSHRESSRIDESDVVEDSQPPRRSRGRLNRVNDLDKGRESVNEGIVLEKSSVSPDAEEVGRDSSPIISVRRSGSANRSRDSTQEKSQSKLSKRRSNIQDRRTPSRVEGKSTGQDSPVSDEEEENDEITQRSGLISLGEASPGLTIPERTETISTIREQAIQPISTSTPADETGVKRKSSAIVPRKSILSVPPKKGVEKTAGITENTEMSESIFLRTPIRRSEEASGPGTQRTGGIFDGDKWTQLKAKLEQVKRQETANLKYIKERKALLSNTKIDSYFKTKSGSGSAGAKTAKKIPTEPKPVNKAYIMNGKVIDPRRPRLSRPKSWATDRLYKFLWKKLEPKYNISTRVRSEKFVKTLSEATTIIQRRKKYDNYKEELNILLREMAHLGIIDTRNDFHLFCQEFLPYEFRIKVIPMLLPGDVRNIPFHPEKLHIPILESLD